MPRADWAKTKQVKKKPKTAAWLMLYRIIRQHCDLYIIHICHLDNQQRLTSSRNSSCSDGGDAIIYPEEHKQNCLFRKEGSNNIQKGEEENTDPPPSPPPSNMGWFTQNKHYFPSLLVPDMTGTFPTLHRSSWTPGRQRIRPNRSLFSKIVDLLLLSNSVNFSGWKEIVLNLKWFFKY